MTVSVMNIFSIDVTIIIVIVISPLDEWGSVSNKCRDSYLRQHVQTGSGAHLASYPTVIDVFLRRLWTGHEANHSSPSSD